jgi:hypothetical protein
MKHQHVIQREFLPFFSLSVALLSPI